MKNATKLAPGLWRLSLPTPEDALLCNSYLIALSEGYCLVDAGPTANGKKLIQAAKTVTPIANIRIIAILDDSPFAWSSLHLWMTAGFHGELVADWRVVTSIAMGGIKARFHDLRAGETSLFPGKADELVVVRPAEAGMTMGLYHKASGSLFSGRFASSIGPDLPDYCEDPGLRAQHLFMESVSQGPVLKTEALAGDSSIRRICPRFGSSIPEALVPAALGLAALSGVCLETAPPPALDPLMRELDALRSSNYVLKEAMVGASDAALRDPASGLYGRSYADAFIQALCERGSDFSAAFVRIDHIKELNRSLGAQAVDLLIKDLADVLNEREAEAFLFRWTGPVLLLIREGGEADLFEHLERLKRAIASDNRFARPITASIALVRSSELAGANPFASLQALARERLKLLDRRGGDAVLDRSDIPIEERSLVLALDSNTLFLDFLVELLEHEGFRTQGVARGGAALELMDRTKPELVIADVSLPQFDAFQIRMRMRASADLHDIPFILLTDVKSDEVIARAHSLGIHHIFEKPVSMVELVGVARSLLARSEDGA